MSTVGIRQLKARLSAYLRQVRSGRTVYVADRGKIIAVLKPPEDEEPSASRARRRWQEAVIDGLIIPPSRPEELTWIRGEQPGAPPGSSATLLDAERDES